MSSIRYHKLVRDRIPELIRASGKTCRTETLSDEAYLNMLDAKLDEELAEYHRDQNLEELADLLEVLRACALARGYRLEELEQVRAQKAAERGGFQQKILLEEVWQAPRLVSQQEFVRLVNVQAETIRRYIREKKLIPDEVRPKGAKGSVNYFSEEKIRAYAREYGWTIIDDSNRWQIFLDMVRQMDMSYSYKPVLIKAIFCHADADGCVKLEDIVSYFRSYYEGRREAGLTVEKQDSIFAKGGYSQRAAARKILEMPCKRFADMQMLRYRPAADVIQVDETVWPI